MKFQLDLQTALAAGRQQQTMGAYALTYKERRLCLNHSRYIVKLICDGGMKIFIENSTVLQDAPSMRKLSISEISETFYIYWYGVKTKKKPGLQLVSCQRH